MSEFRKRFQLIESAQFLLDKAEDIMSESYVPTLEDLLQCVVRTTGIVDERFEICGTKFSLWDTGGQRVERKRWIHAYEGLSGMIFRASLSEYD
jgi:hypothetical protein